MRYMYKDSMMICFSHREIKILAMKPSELVWDQTNRSSENIVTVGEWPGQGLLRMIFAIHESPDAPCESPPRLPAEIARVRENH
jgi:hypothetical protein